MKIAAGIATSSIAVGGSARSVSSGVPQRSAQSVAGRAAFAEGKLAVQYDTARFGNARTFEGVESAHGLINAQTLVAAGTLVTRVL